MALLISPASIALNRFGLGARPEDAPPADPRSWLLDQLGRYQPRSPAFVGLPDASGLLAAYLASQRTLGQMRQAVKAAAAPPSSAGVPPVPEMAMPSPPQRDAAIQQIQQTINAKVQAAYRAAANARMASALATDTPFVERLVHFWANHFAISTEKPEVSILAGAYEAEAIRPHVLGRFQDMLFAVEQHPAMLYFLDQINSTGPNSKSAVAAAKRQPGRPLGLNENLAREIMELHTLGVRSGYSQADVTEFARALTGWSIVTPVPTAILPDPSVGRFLYKPNIHEPGTRTILGQHYADTGEQQAAAILAALAAAPATATHLSTKLARHFVADDPPPALVARMAKAYRDGQGDLTAVYRVLIEARESWSTPETKFKSPWDWTVSTFRALGRRDIGQTDITSIQNQLGQPVWRPGSPAGYDDIAAAWAAPDALIHRLEFAQRFAAASGNHVDARALAPKLMPAAVSDATAAALAQADTGATALALLLVSPEFQRR